jgi:CubicO group peptidase (beta-lactamase class C family)
MRTTTMDTIEWLPHAAARALLAAVVASAALAILGAQAQAQHSHGAGNGGDRPVLHLSSRAGQEPSTVFRGPASTPSRPQGPTDAGELETFLDSLLRRQMEERHIAGAAVAVVRNGELFFAKGYGYADLENRTPVDAARTVFRIGSVTKLFTWTAVMQLVEQGRLDLDVDVNTYLDFRIPDTYPQPITLRHLLTHTAGFEDLHYDMVTLQEEHMAPPRQWLVSHVPARVFPPGALPAYSNYGAALAGYVVARLSGESYSRYVQREILDPLGMSSSTANPPIRSDLRARESVGYMYRNGAFERFPRLINPVDLFPTGIVFATVTDMARFMSAHLQGGRYGDVSSPERRILADSTTRQMHSTLYRPHPHLLGTTYGFFDFTDNGQRTLGHSGQAEPMASLLLLLPDQQLGVFVAYNSLSGAALTRQHFGFQRAFFDHYYPAPALEPLHPPADFRQRADQFVGVYRNSRSAFTTLEKFTSLMNPGVEVRNPGDGTLLLATPWGDWRILEESALYFRQVDGPFHFAFRRDARGRIAHLFTDFTPMLAFQKVPWYDTRAFNMPLLLLCLLLFLSLLPVALISTIRSYRARNDRASAPGGARAGYWLIVGVGILNLLFVAGNVRWGEQIVFGIPFAYRIVLGLGVASAVLTIGALVYAVLAWRGSYWGSAFRVYYTLQTVAAVAFVWFLNNWNLLGWRF